MARRDAVDGREVAETARYVLDFEQRHGTAASQGGRDGASAGLYRQSTPRQHRNPLVGPAFGAGGRAGQHSRAPAAGRGIFREMNKPDRPVAARPAARAIGGTARAGHGRAQADRGGAAGHRPRPVARLPLARRGARPPRGDPPEVAHQFQLANILTLDRPRFDRGFVTLPPRPFAGFEVLTYVEMFYNADRLARRSSCASIPAAASGIEERLRASTMQFQYQTEQDDKKVVRYGLFHVQPVDRRVGAVPARLRAADHRGHAAQRRPLRVGLARVPARTGSTRRRSRTWSSSCWARPNGFLRRAPLALIKPRATSSRRRRPLRPTAPTVTRERSAARRGSDLLPEQQRRSR